MSEDSLVICTTCNEQIARSAASCPKCGSARSFRERLTASQLRVVYYLIAIIFSMAIHPIAFFLVVFGGGFYLFRNKFSARPKLVRNIGIGVGAFLALIIIAGIMAPPSQNDNAKNNAKNNEETRKASTGAVSQKFSELRFPPMGASWQNSGCHKEPEGVRIIAGTVYQDLEDRYRCYAKHQAGDFPVQLAFGDDGLLGAAYVGLSQGQSRDLFGGSADRAIDEVLNLFGRENVKEEFSGRLAMPDNQNSNYRAFSFHCSAHLFDKPSSFKYYSRYDEKYGDLVMELMLNIPRDAIDMLSWEVSRASAGKSDRCIVASVLWRDKKLGKAKISSGAEIRQDIQVFIAEVDPAFPYLTKTKWR
jgi:hypothetical protein